MAIVALPIALAWSVGQLEAYFNGSPCFTSESFYYPFRAAAIFGVLVAAVYGVLKFMPSGMDIDHNGIHVKGMASLFAEGVCSVTLEWARINGVDLYDLGNERVKIHIKYQQSSDSIFPISPNLKSPTSLYKLIEYMERKTDVEVKSIGFWEKLLLW